jgi:hypothetical protein
MKTLKLCLSLTVATLLLASCGEPERGKDRGTGTAGNLDRKSDPTESKGQAPTNNDPTNPRP